MLSLLLKDVVYPDSDLLPITTSPLGPCWSVTVYPPSSQFTRRTSTCQRMSESQVTVYLNKMC
jgi:hypothetical protein